MNKYELKNTINALKEQIDEIDIAEHKEFLINVSLQYLLIQKLDQICGYLENLERMCKTKQK